MRAATGRDFDIRLAVYDGDVLTNADNTPSVTVTDAAGDTVPTGAVSPISTGLYRAKIDAIADATRLTVTWSYDVDGYARAESDIVPVDESFIFETHELRSMPSLTDTDRYTIEQLEQARDDVTDFINDFTMTAFVPTFDTMVIDGRARTNVLLTRIPAIALSTVLVDGVVKSTSGWTVGSDGLVRAPSSWMTYSRVGRNVSVSYTYGYPRPPQDLKRAALKLASSWLTSFEGSIPDRARMMTTQWGTFQLDTARDEYPTGIPDVDSALRRYKVWVPSFA